MSYANTVLALRDTAYQILAPTTGKTFWVDSVTGSSTGPGTSPKQPFSTIDAAIAYCTANKGDRIMVMPGHVETVSAANGLDFDVAGIQVFFLGHGSNRASVNITATAGTIRVNANGVYIEGMLVTGGIDAVALCIDVNGKTDCTFRDLRYRDVTGQCTVFFKAANNSDRLTIDGVKYLGDSAAGTTAAFQFDGCDDLVFQNFDIVGNFGTAAVNFITTASARVRINAGPTGSFIWNQNSADVCILDTITGCTGNINATGGLSLRLTDNAANITEAITGATFAVFDNVWVCNLAGEKAMLINWTASTDA